MNAKDLAKQCKDLATDYGGGSLLCGREEETAQRLSKAAEALERYAELEQRYALLSGEVSAWICTACHEAFPPAKLNPGLMCLVCPRCGGSTMTLGRYELEEERNRADRFQARYAELEADAERFRFWFGPEPRSFDINRYLEGVHDEWTLEQWRTFCDESRPRKST